MTTPTTSPDQSTPAQPPVVSLKAPDCLPYVGDFQKGAELQDMADRLFMEASVAIKHILICGFDNLGNVKIRISGKDYTMLPSWKPGKPVNCTYWVRGMMQGGLPA